MSVTRVFSTLSDYFYQFHRPLSSASLSSAVHRSTSSPAKMETPVYVLYRDGEPIMESDNLDQVFKELDQQLSHLQTVYVPPENLLTIDQLDDGIRVLTRNTNFIPSYDSVLAEFVVRFKI